MLNIRSPSSPEKHTQIPSPRIGPPAFGGSIKVATMAKILKRPYAHTSFSSADCTLPYK